MGLLAVWFFRATMPLRDLRFRLNHLKYQLMAKIFGYQKLERGIVGDVRKLGRAVGGAAGAGQKSQPQQKAPPKAPQRAPQRYPPRKR